ncbi:MULTISPECIES: hypothetical protein [unclassified Lysobacter]
MRHHSIPFVIRPLAVVATTAAGLFFATALAQRPVPVSVAPQLQAQALQAPQSREEGGQAMDSAVAAALIGAISDQFDARRVEVTLDKVHVAPLSVRDRSVSGNGRLRIGDAPDWIAMSFNALYDTATASVSRPVLVLNDGQAGEVLQLDSDLARALDREVNSALASEFSQQSVQLLIERVTTTASDQRFVQLRALGIAEFSGEGTTPAQVSALYDRDTGEWLRVDYELGTSSNWAEQAEPAVASN